ncbi:MAG: ankyrin repeat domain-containing protein [Planctomycetaceae bacterium]|jgi:ankyrin repeat protein/actin-like ATPase involved in cell morphogenesis|nr:ankyrin repeat domain-containing protein [Planctomycetaceae bacterium]
MGKQTATLAIDFGTSRTKVAYFDENQNRPVLVEIGRNIRTMIPSAFYVPAPVDGKIIESEILVGDDAEDQLDDDPDGYVVAIKKEIHKTGFKRLGGGRKVERIELASYLFRYVKEHTESSVPYFINRSIDTCILTVPVSFSTIQREAIRQAAEKGNFRNIKIIEEPVAAACAWLSESYKEGIEYVVVCDIGGGTTDFAIVRFKNEIFQPVPEIPTKGFNWGGDDLDERIIERLHDINDDADSNDDVKQNYWQRITNWRSAFKSKIRNIKEFLIKRNKEIYDAKIQDVKLQVPQKEITRCIDEFVEEVCCELDVYLKQCYEKLNRRDIPVLLVGGSSQLRGLEEKVKTIAGEKNVYRWSNSEYAIVLGATLDGINTKNIQTKKQTQEEIKTFNTPIKEVTPATLSDATENGDIEVKELINAGVDIHAIDQNGWTALHYAVCYNNPNIEMLKYLISKGVNVNAKTKNLITPLHMAARYNPNIDILKYLVSQGADTSAKDDNYETPLDYAIASKHHEKVTYLKSLSNPQTNARPNINATPEALFDAAKNGDLDKVKELINAGVNVNAKDKYGWTTLHYTSRINTNIKIFQYLISQGADVNARNQIDETPLHFAAGYNTNVKILKHLISQGADVNAKNKIGETPLHFATTYNNTNIEILKYLISQGADINAKNKDGETPLDTAKRNEVIDYLISHGGTKNKTKDWVDKVLDWFK